MAATAISHLHGKLLSSTVCSPPLLNPNHRSFYRPIVAAATIDHQNKSYWSAIETHIDSHLNKSITIRPPTSVFEPMHHLTFSASRSTAPPLCVAACELVGGSADDAITAAAAIHLMHAAAFTHMHLPLTDGPMHVGSTVQHMFKPNIELLTPDAMVPFGFELLGLSQQAQKNPDRILRVIIELSRAVGSQGIMDGMYQELLYTRSKGEDEEMVEYVCEKKEGELHACAGACGAILGGGSEEEIEKMRKYGLYVGMIQGILNGVGKNKEEGRSEIVKKWKDLAMKELETFHGKNVDQISSLLEMH